MTLATSTADPYGLGLRIDDGDLVLAGGRLAEVSAVPNLSQALTLRVLTPYGSDRFNVTYGLDVSQTFTQPNGVSMIRELLKLNLVRTLGTDPRVRDIRQITFDDDPAAQHRRVWTARVELDTVAGSALSLAVDIRLEQQ